jgi:RNA polymerase sigma factor (sigma-70 family)
MNREFITKIYSNEYKSIVVQAIRHICPNISESDLDDCVSDVYLTAIGTAGLVDHPDIKGWLFNVARNVAKRYRRQLGIQKVKQFNETTAVEVASEIDVVELVEEKICSDNSELLSLLQKNLKVSEYTLFKMKYFDKKSNSEIADFIGIKKHSVDVKITRLHERIKAVLEGTKYERESAPSKLKRVAVLLTILVVATLLLQGMAMALGYDNFIDMIRAAISSPDGRAENPAIGRETVFTDGFRTYNSMSELLVAENLSILYPSRLPTGYEFTVFEVVDLRNGLRIQAFAIEPFITFAVMINADFEIDNYDYEVNGISHNITVTDESLYQAFWNIGVDYYEIIVNERAILSEIINSLTGE